MAIDVPAPRGPIFVFGDYFLRKFYTVFDRDQKVVGISRANHEKDINTESNMKNIVTPYDGTSDINILKNQLSTQVEEEISNSKKMMSSMPNGPLNMSDLIEKLEEYPEFLEISES